MRSMVVGAIPNSTPHCSCVCSAPPPPPFGRSPSPASLCYAWEDNRTISAFAGELHLYRSFSVDRPASASTTEMIQNRITICGSVQPICSKW
jgi:hypothetical protein